MNYTGPFFQMFFMFKYFKTFLLLLGCIGFLANLLVLPVLLSKEMENTFNHLLICLTIFDNVYVMCSILECIRKYFISTVEQMVSKISRFDSVSTKVNLSEISQDMSF